MDLGTGPIATAIRNLAPESIEELRAALDGRIANQYDSRYGLADLAPGSILLSEIGRAKNVGTGNLEAWGTRIVNTCYGAIAASCAKVRRGAWFHPLPQEDAELYWEAELQDSRRTAALINALAEEQGSAFRVRAEIMICPWPHDRPRLRKQMARVMADGLVRLREACMDSTRERYLTQREALENIEIVVLGQQHELVVRALESVERQRPAVIARYVHGRNEPVDFAPLDQAIRAFCPDWVPPGEPAR